MAGNQPGDGRTSPFGDGAGKASGGNVAGNNFISNPGGSNSGAVRPRDFQRPAPEKSLQSRATDESKDINTMDAAPGPRTAAEAADKGDDAGNPIGTGTQGREASMPFRLGGD